VRKTPTLACARCGRHRQVRSGRGLYCADCRLTGNAATGEWTAWAACRSVAYDPEWWWPTKGNEPTAAIAVAACRYCRVRQQCLDFALENRETSGIWGGLTAEERSKLNRKQVV